MNEKDKIITDLNLKFWDKFDNWSKIPINKRLDLVIDYYNSIIADLILRLDDLDRRNT